MAPHCGPNGSARPRPRSAVQVSSPSRRKAITGAAGGGLRPAGCSGWTPASGVAGRASLWLSSEVKGSRVKVQGSRFKVQGSRFKVQGSRFKVQGSRFKVQGSRFKVQGSRFKGYGISDLRNIHADNYKLFLAQRAPTLP